VGKNAVEAGGAEILSGGELKNKLLEAVANNRDKARLGMTMGS
jgi:hypothetical protein